MKTIKKYYKFIAVFLAGIIIGITTYIIFQNYKLDDVKYVNHLEGGSSLSYIPPIVDAENEPDNSFSQAFHINLNEKITGIYNHPQDTDFYSFSVAKPELIIVSVSNLPSENDLIIFDSKKQIIASSHRTGISSTDFSINLKTAGTYYLKISSNKVMTKDKDYYLYISAKQN